MVEGTPFTVNANTTVTNSSATCPANEIPISGSWQASDIHATIIDIYTSMPTAGAGTAQPGGSWTFSIGADSTETITPFVTCAR